MAARLQWLTTLLGLVVSAESQATNAIFNVGLYAVPGGNNLKLRYHGACSPPHECRTNLIREYRAFPFPPLLFFLWHSWVSSPYSPRRRKQAVVVFGGVMALSIVWYYFQRCVYWFTGPVIDRNVDLVPDGLVECDDHSSGRGKRWKQLSQKSVVISLQHINVMP